MPDEQPDGAEQPTDDRPWWRTVDWRRVGLNAAQYLGPILVQVAVNRAMDQMLGPRVKVWKPFNRAASGQFVARPVAKVLAVEQRRRSA